MRKFLVLLDRELRSYFLSPTGYIVLCFFLIWSGFNLYATVSIINGRALEHVPAEYYFNGVFFWLGYLLLVPLLTMRLYSEEFKMGTVETLMTAPVRDWQVVAAKFAGALLLYLMLWLLSGLYLLLFNSITGQAAVQSTGALAGSFLLLLVMGCFYLSLGCLASVLTQNQVVAAVIALVGSFVFFFTGILMRALPNLDPRLRELASYFSSFDHMVTFSTGIIDTRPVVFYLSLAALLQVITFQVFQYRRWKA